MGITRKDVAKMAGVSEATVSYVAIMEEILYDQLVSPEVHECDEDKSKETEFGN